MPPAADDHSLARLYLRAVLPALPAFVRGDAQARDAIEAWRFAVRFTSTSGVATTLAFRDGAVAVDPPRPGFALRLLFLSDREVVRAFRRAGAPRVLPWGGLHHLARLPALARLLTRMEAVLSAPPDEVTRYGWQELRVDLLFGHLLPAAVAELGTHERGCRRLLAPFGDFAARIAVPGVTGGWLARRGDRIAGGHGNAPSSPDVQIEFRDAAVALSAADGRIDHLAASATGEILIRGMIPLAEALAQVMERASLCLDPDPS